MKRLVTSLCFVMLLVSGCKTTSPSDPSDDAPSYKIGLSAYKSGDYATALSEWKPLVDQGGGLSTAEYAAAQYGLGVMYFRGYGVPKNSDTALFWWREAASQGVLGAVKFLEDEGLHSFVKKYEEEEIKASNLKHDNRIRRSYISSNRLWQERQRREIERRNKRKDMLASYKRRCIDFGFKDGSKEMSKCMFDLYKLEKAKSQTRTVIQNNSGDSSAVRALLEEQRKQREMEGSLEMLKRGLDMMNPPTTRCRFNSLMKTMVCR